MECDRGDISVSLQGSNCLAGFKIPKLHGTVVGPDCKPSPVRAERRVGKTAGAAFQIAQLLAGISGIDASASVTIPGHEQTPVPANDRGSDGVRGELGTNARGHGPNFLAGRGVEPLNNAAGVGNGQLAVSRKAKR